MTKLEEVIDLLEHLAQNADRIARNARLVSELLQLVDAHRGKPVKDAVLPLIKDYVSNLVWNADPNLEVDRDSTAGMDQLEESLTLVVKRITGRKIEWHPRS